MTTRTKEAIWGYVFILPWIIGFVAFSLGPIVATIYLAFTKYNVIQKPRFIGFRNFVNLFTSDADYIQSVLVTVKYTLYRVPAIIIVGLLLAVLINQMLERSR